MRTFVVMIAVLRESCELDSKWIRCPKNEIKLLTSLFNLNGFGTVVIGLGHVAKRVILCSRSGFFTCVRGSGSDLNLNPIWFKSNIRSWGEFGLLHRRRLTERQGSGGRGVVAERARCRATGEVARSLVVQALEC